LMGEYRKYQVLVSKIKPPITNTANNKTSNNEGRLYTLNLSMKPLSYLEMVVSSG
jgi:hypothetical protein